MIYNNSAWCIDIDTNDDLMDDMMNVNFDDYMYFRCLFMMKM